MLSQGVATIIVDHEKLQELVESAGGVTLPKGAVTVFGGFRMNDEGELEFQVCWDSTDNHPTMWASGAPEWMKDVK